MSEMMMDACSKCDSSAQTSAEGKSRVVPPVSMHQKP